MPDGFSLPGRVSNVAAVEETREVTRARVDATIKRLVQPAIWLPVQPVTVLAHHVHGEPVPLADVLSADFQPFSVGDRWGAAWETTWFRFQGRLPEDWLGATVDLRLGFGYHRMPGFGAEGTVWDVIAGAPVQGISPKHDTFRLPRVAGEFDVWVEAAANPIASMGLPPAPLLAPDYGGSPLYRLDRAEIAVFNADVYGLYHDMHVLLDLYEHIAVSETEGRRAADVLRALNSACNAIDPEDIAGTADEARLPLARALRKPAHASAHVLSAVGNAHIDTAWLWPLRETRRKCARTFSTALRLMDDHPDYRFACSQAVQLAWIKEDHPALWERLRKKVAAGQFVPVGCMWVEPDCNVPSGESLVRQIVHGKRFFLDEFGIETDEVWLPDVFGYSAALPQIMRLAGVSRFLTQKLSWNRVNRMPHDTFWWEGIDGSRVFTHFPPADTYNGDFSMDQLSHAASKFRDHGVAARSLYLFGYGDGGGGPTRDMLEAAHRLADLEGAPRVELTGPAEFWAAAEAETAHADLAVWSGELYFEFHRGTYTTHAEVKRGNRRMEFALREAEIWSSLAGVSPTGDLDRAWKRLLLHQFHDILPGTSINWVYLDVARDHAEIGRVAGGVAEGGRAALAGAGDAPVFFNSLSWPRREVVEVDGGLVMADVPAMGFAAATVAEAGVGPVPSVEVDGLRLENEHLRVTFDADGLIASIWDKAAAREVVAPGRVANLFQLHHDRPLAWDAWDIDAYYMEQVADIAALDSLSVVEHGGLRGALRMVRSFGRSRVSQTVRLAAGSRRVDFVTEVDWHEDHKLLKVAFPVDVHARRATYEIQYGHVERPTHRNTSWDVARFEVCGHKWADLSEPGYGVALLNDGKYGHDVFENVMRLTLLRSPSSPDPEADRGTHTFTYSLLPHAGDFRQAGVIRAGYELNVPISVARGDATIEPWTAMSVDRDNVVVEVVKQADRSDELIVRLYESWGARGPVTLRFGFPVRDAAVVDLLERHRESVDVVDGTVRLDLSPFQIATLSLRR